MDMSLSDTAGASGFMPSGLPRKVLGDKDFIPSDKELDFVAAITLHKGLVTKASVLSKSPILFCGLDGQIFECSFEKFEESFKPYSSDFGIPAIPPNAHWTLNRACANAASPSMEQIVRRLASIPPGIKRVFSNNAFRKSFDETMRAAYEAMATDLGYKLAARDRARRMQMRPIGRLNLTATSYA